jgi:hypothetical protein
MEVDIAPGSYTVFKSSVPALLDTPAGSIVWARYHDLGSTVYGGAWFHYYNSATAKDYSLLGVSGDGGGGAGRPDQVSKVKLCVGADGNVGIGTNFTSTAKLHVNGSGQFEGNLTLKGSNNLMPNQTLTGSSSILTLGLADARYLANNSNGLTLDSSGRLGIGTSNPTAKLQVNGTAQFNDRVAITSGNLSVGSFEMGEIAPGIYSSTGTGSGYEFARRDLTAWLGSPSAGDRWVMYAPNNAGMRMFTDGGGDLFFFGKTGEFGIGTTAPSAKLHVNGTSRFDGPVRIAPQGDISMGNFTSE